MTWSFSLEICLITQLQMDLYESFIAFSIFHFSWISHKWWKFDVIPVLDYFQVKIQKDSEVRLKIIGTRVDATEIVSHQHNKTFFCPYWKVRRKIRSRSLICAKDMNALLILIIKNSPIKFFCSAWCIKSIFIHTVGYSNWTIFCSDWSIKKKVFPSYPGQNKENHNILSPFYLSNCWTITFLWLFIFFLKHLGVI